MMERYSSFFAAYAVGAGGTQAYFYWAGLSLNEWAAIVGGLSAFGAAGASIIFGWLDYRRKGRSKD